MGMIGAWGNVVFGVSRREVKTFDGLKWESGAKYATHVRHLKSPLLEYVGTEIETISFQMLFSAFLGVNPMAEIKKLQSAVHRGKANRLVIGAKVYGRNRWVITKLSNSLERYDNHGNLLVAKVNITMKSYAAR